MVLTREHFNGEPEQVRDFLEIGIVRIERRWHVGPSGLMSDSTIKYRPAFPLRIETRGITYARVPGEPCFIDLIVDVPRDALCESSLWTCYGAQVDIRDPEPIRKRREFGSQVLHRFRIADIDEAQAGIKNGMPNAPSESPLREQEAMARIGRIHDTA